MKPFDIHLILGDDNSGKEIAKLDIDFEFKPENVSFKGRSLLNFAIWPRSANQ